MRHNLVYLLQNETDSDWKAVQQHKYETLLVANNMNSKVKLTKLAGLEADYADELLNHEEIRTEYMDIANAMINTTLNAE